MPFDRQTGRRISELSPPKLPRFQASMDSTARVLGETKEVPPPVVRLQATARRIHQAKLWQYLQRWQEAERWLERLEALVVEVEGEV